MPKGFVYPETIKKEEAKAAMQQLVLAQMRPIVRALIGKAIGINHMMLRDTSTGQWIRLTEPEQIEQALNATGAEEGKTYWIHTKDPDVQAAADLLNRAIGKAVEEQNVTLTVNEPLAQRLKRTKERLGL